MRRLLFVDDEKMVLDGLQRMLRRYRNEWEPTFVTSGNEALAKLSEEHYDVIVTDMRMPGMDGAQLLELVRERHPGVIRIVLSGQCDTVSAVRATPVAHQFLSKPCDPIRLQEVIERSCRCDTIVIDESTRRVITAIGELPPLPRTYGALMDALNDPDTTLEQVGSIVQRDVAVAAKVLQLVNSAFFGLSCEIATVPMAVGYLGFEVLKQLVMTVELFRTFSCDLRAPGFSIDEIQRHSRAVAGIAARLPIPPQQTAATSVAALLHDVGKLVLAVRLKKPFQQALEASLRENRPLYSVEEELTGTNHAHIGAYLLGLWGLPAAVVGAISQHHGAMTAAADGQFDSALAVHIADLLANEADGRFQSCADTILQPGIEQQLSAWKESLPQWREMAAEVVRAED